MLRRADHLSPPSFDSTALSACTAVCLAAMTACTGPDEGEGTAGTDPLEEACYHIAEGTVVDGGASAEAAPDLTPGIDPYRVVLQEDAPTFVRVSTGAGTLSLLSDLEDAFASLSTDGADVSLPAAAANETCPQDILTTISVGVDAGEHLVEIGATYKATAWLVIAAP